MASRNWLRIGLGACTLGLVYSCASAPIPRALDEAAALLRSADRQQLLGSRPQLVAKADQAYAKARKAHDRGDDEGATLLATQAIHRYKTAREFNRRDETRALTKVMARNERTAEGEAQQALTRSEELARFAQMEQKLASLNGELQGYQAAASSDLAEAKKALAAARRRQAAALRAGAVEGAPSPYGEGRLLVESSVESLGLGLVQEAKESATLALGAFDQAIVEVEQAKLAAEAPKALEPQGPDASPLPTVAIPSAEPAQLPGTGARRAIEQAETLRLEALRAGRTPQETATADQWLEEAHHALTNHRTTDTENYARRAAGLYANLLRPVAPAATGPSRDPDLRRSVEDRLVRSQFERSELIGRLADQICAAGFREFEGILALAHERFKEGDYMRAHEFLVRADERLRSCKNQLGAAAVAAPREADSAARESVARRAAADAMQRAQTGLASKKTDGRDPRELAEVESLLASAERWYSRGDFPQAQAMASRASGLVAALPAVTKSPPVAPSATMTPEVNRKQAAKQLRETQRALAAHKRKRGDAAAAEEAALLLGHAEKWFERQAFEQSLELATQAVEALAEPATATTTPATVATATTKQPSPKERAEEALTSAQGAIAERSAVAPSDQSVRRASSLVAAAERWYDRGAYVRTERLANEATELMAAAQQPETAAADVASPPSATAQPKQRQDQKPEAKASKPKLVAQPAAAARQAEQGAPAADCDTVWEQFEKTRSLADRTDLKKLAAPEQRSLTEAEGLLAVAKRRLGEEKCDQAQELVAEARSVVYPMPRGASRSQGRVTRQAPDRRQTGGARSKVGGNVAAAQPPAPSSSKSEQTVAVAAQASSAEGWGNAYAQVMEALRLRDRARHLVTNDTRKLYESANRTLARVQRDYASNRYSSAGAGAERASKEFRTIIQAGEQSRDQRIAAAVKRSSKDRKDLPEGWENGYRGVYKALALQEEAKAAAPAEGQLSVARGDSQLAKARAAWKAKKFADATAFAAAAAREYERALSGEDAPAPQQSRPAQADRQPVANKAAVTASAAPSVPPQDLELQRVESYRRADTSLREALVVASVCEQQQCAERDVREYARAQQLLDSAQRALSERDYDYVAELSEQAKDVLNSILATPRPDTEGKRAEASKKERREADRALREANIQYKLCQKQQCELRDHERWLRASELLPAATAAQSDGRYDEARELASDALKSLQAALDAKPVFAVPAQAESVYLEGEQLRVSPPIEFKAGGATMTPGSQEAVAQLALVLRMNGGTVRAVRVLGYTDSKGKPARNKALSAKRAQAVVRALRAAGAGDIKMTFEGKGASDFVADNTTAEGRRANRRVEIHLDLQ